MPYAPHAWSTLDALGELLVDRCVPKSGDGTISGIAPGCSSHRRVELQPARSRSCTAPAGRRRAGRVAFADGHDRGVQRERLLSFWSGARVEPPSQPARRPCGRGRSPRCSSGCSCPRASARRGRGARAGLGRPAAGQLGLHRRHADPVPLEELVVARILERVRVRPARRRTTRPPRTALEVARLAVAQPRWPGRPCGGHVGEVEQAADRVDGVVELLLAHPRRARRCRGPRASRRRRRRALDDVAHVAHARTRTSRRGTRRRRSSARSARRARELRRLVGVARVGVARRSTPAVGVTSWTTLPLSPLITWLTSRSAAQVILDRAELAGGDRGERRVLAVGGEHPRVVGPAGAEPARLGDGADRRRVPLAGVGDPDRRSRDSWTDVGEVLLAPVDALLRAAGRRAGRASCARRARRARPSSRFSAPSGSARCPSASPARRRRRPLAACAPATPNQIVFSPPAGTTTW